MEGERKLLSSVCEWLKEEMLRKWLVYLQPILLRPVLEFIPLAQTTYLLQAQESLLIRAHFTLLHQAETYPAYFLSHLRCTTYTNSAT